MSKRPTGFVYIGSIINYLLYLPDPFPRGLEVDLKGSSIFPTLMPSMHVDRLGLLNHLYRSLFNCATMWQGSWAGTTALHMEVRWHCTIAVSAWCSKHELPACECIVKRSCIPSGRLNAAYICIYGDMQLYVHGFK